MALALFACTAKLVLERIDAIRDGRDVTSGRHINAAGIKEDERIIDEGMPAGGAARQIDAVLR